MNGYMSIRPIEPSDRDWVIGLLTSRWRSPNIVTRGVIYDASQLPGFICHVGSERAGLITYHINQGECVIISLDSMREGIGVGTQLIEAVQKLAIESGCRRLWLITTNDNLPALRFYQKRGFCLVAVHREAINASRMLKPEISEIGLFGIPLRDEIELEIPLLHE